MGMSGVDGTGAAAARFLEPRRLQPGEELGSFSCSVELIDDWAAKHASYAAKQGTAVPYVCFTTDGDVAGFYAISAYSIDRETVRGGWLRRNVPAKFPRFYWECWAWIPAFRSGAWAGCCCRML